VPFLWWRLQQLERRVASVNRLARSAATATDLTKLDEVVKEILVLTGLPTSQQPAVTTTRQWVDNGQPVR